jgi:hypothetical protein
MATIIYDNLTEGKWRARWEDGDGEHTEFCETQQEAQLLINREMVWKLAKYEAAEEKEKIALKKEGEHLLIIQ